MLPSMSLHDCRKLTSFNSLAQLVISRSVFSKYFIFSKDAALGLDQRCDCFQCVSFNVLRPVSCVFHAPYMPFWYQVYTSGIDFNPHDFYCPNGFSFMFLISFKYLVLVHHTVILAPYITNPFIYAFDINWSETSNENLQLIISRFCP